MSLPIKLLDPLPDGRIPVCAQDWSQSVLLGYLREGAKGWEVWPVGGDGPKVLQLATKWKAVTTLLQLAVDVGAERMELTK